MERREVPTGERVFDWTIPQEWHVNEAYVIMPTGEKILDFAEHNLHLVGYSTAFDGTLSRVELDEHLYSLPELPRAIPYVTSYYSPRWGFCIPHEQRETLPEGNYKVVVDTKHFSGSLSFGEAVLPGESDKSILISTYCCHPMMANNELSGPILAAYLYRRLAKRTNRRYTYRFAFVPETIGALAYLKLRNSFWWKKNIIAGYVATCVGFGQFTYKRSRIGNSIADRAALSVLREQPHTVQNYSPTGSDERQYCSPGFNLPVGSLARTMHGTYPEYHTSLDNSLDFSALQEAIDIYEQIVDVLEDNRTYLSLVPLGEPQLGNRGLYPSLSTRQSRAQVSAMMWVLGYADGKHDLLTISELSDIPVRDLVIVAEKATEVALLEAS